MQATWKLVPGTFKELEHIYCQSIEGQYWDSYCQVLSPKKQFAQVSSDKLSPCGHEAVGNHLFPMLPAALPAVYVQLYLLLRICCKAI